MKVIGLTGSFGTGKTFAASAFKGLGARVIDADKLSHELIRRGSGPYRRITALFGKGVIDKDGSIDRKKLADIVFTDRKKLKMLEGIIHPAVIRKIKDQIRRVRGKDIVVIDAPLIIEARAMGLIDKLVVVSASRKTQVERCMKRFKIGRSDVLRRIASQLSLKEKIKKADFVIDNDGFRSETRRQVKKIWERIYGDR